MLLHSWPTFQPPQHFNIFFALLLHFFFTIKSTKIQAKVLSFCTIANKEF